jgi:hypothetical protein
LAAASVIVALPEIEKSREQGIKVPGSGLPRYLDP